MKKFILAALATATLVGPIMTAPAEAQQVHRETTTVRDRPDGRTVVTQRTVVRGTEDRRWNKGDRFDRRRVQNYRAIPDWRPYRSRRLYAPPRGYHWVRSAGDAVLITRGGIVSVVIPNAFR